jgi:hypothetical protein
MLKSADMFKELEVIEKVRESSSDDVAKALMKLGDLQVKLLHSIRKNQVLLMKKQGITFKKEDEEAIVETPTK